MDPEQYKLIHEAVREGLASTQWLFVVMSFVIAGVGVFLGGYLKKKAESVASHEDFQKMFGELEKQTKMTTGIQTTLQKEVEGLKDSLERERTFGAFVRTRIAQHLDLIFTAANDIGTLSRLVAKRSWADSDTLADAEQTLHSQVSSIKLNAGILLKLNAVSESLCSKVLACLNPITSAWDNMIGELTLRDPKFRQEHPETKLEFSPVKYNDLWGKFLQACDRLQESVLDLPASVVIPK